MSSKLWADQSRARIHDEKRRQKDRRRQRRKSAKGMRRIGRTLKDWW